MATTSKNEKFDSFLKRTLNSKVYHQVKISEPCVIISAKEKYRFKYVFYTDECLYLTDNPPKVVLLSIPFSSLRDVQVVHDHAKFLQKELQNIAQHILIKFVSCITKTSVNDFRSSRNSETQQPSSGQESQQNSFRSDSTNSIWRSFKSSLNRTSSFKQSSALSKGGVTDDDMQNDDDTDSLCGLGYNTTTTASKDLTSNYGEYETDSRNYLGDDAMAVTSFNGNLSTEKSTGLSKNWTAGDTFQICLLENEKLPTSDLHLYLLNESSSFYNMFRSVWKEYLLSSTLAMAVEDKPTHEKLLKENVNKPMLDALKGDILRSFQCNAAIEDVYQYFLELKSVIKENILCKAHFWKDGDTFTVIANFLFKFSNSRTQEHLKKMDEMDCMILIYQTLTEMLRQTEAMSACNDVLQKIRTETYANLISAILRPPLNIDDQFIDEEMQSVLQECSVEVCSVLYELIETADRVSWSNQGSNNVFTTSFLFAQINVNSNLLSFLKSAVNSCVRIWTAESPKLNDSLVLNAVDPSFSTGSGLLGASHQSINHARSSPHQSHPINHSSGSVYHGEPLSPQSVVTAYRVFSVLHRCFTRCKSIKDIFQQTFKEEFTYFIRPEHLDVKISAAHPAGGITRNIVKGVWFLVLDQTSQSGTFSVSGFERT